LLVTFTAALIIIVCISPAVKYFIQKYDVEFCGREITMGHAYVNPFTGYAYFSNFKIYEEHSDSIALSADGAAVDFNVWKSFSKYFEIDHLTLDHPTWIVIKRKNDFNYTSFLDSCSSEATDSSKAWGFNIFDLTLKQGIIQYYQEDLPVRYFIKEADIDIAGKLIDADTVAFNFYFHSGPGTGTMKGNFTVNFNTLDYQCNVQVKQYDLTQADQYMKPFLNYGSFTAHLDADLKAKGNFDNGENLTAAGLMKLSDLHFGKNPEDDYLAFDHFTFGINELSPVQKVYRFDSIVLNRPYFKYEQYDQLDNIETILKDTLPDYSPHDVGEFNILVAIAHYLKVLTTDFFQSYYKVDRFAFENGDVEFNNYSLSEKFHIGLKPLQIYADSLDKNKTREYIYLKSPIEPYGHCEAAVTLFPDDRDTGNFNLSYSIQKIPASMFNPYVITYTSYPLDHGTLSLKGNWKVRNHQIQSDNQLLLSDPQFAKSQKQKDNKWIPAPLIMSIIQESGNTVNYDIPVTGRLSDPHFHLRTVLAGIFKNIFIKAPGTRYKSEIGKEEIVLEKFFQLQWPMNKSKLADHEEDFLEKLARYLKKNPDASLDIYPQVYATRELEYIAYAEAKKKFARASQKQPLTKADLIHAEKLSLRDSAFARYLNAHNKDTLLFSNEEKCFRLVGSTAVNAAMKQLNKERENTFLSYFKKHQLDLRVKIHPAKQVIPYNGFSFYKIEYKGEKPEQLLASYEKMHELKRRQQQSIFEKEHK
jgi:hypothetical protein